MAKITGRRFGHIRRLRLAEDKLSHARLNSSPKTSTMSNALRHSGPLRFGLDTKAYEPNDSKGVNLPILSLNPVPLQGACVSREGIRVDGSPYNPISSRTYFTAGLP